MVKLYCASAEMSNDEIVLTVKQRIVADRMV